jgi:hypothetical protein
MHDSSIAQEDVVMGQAMSEGSRHVGAVRRLVILPAAVAVLALASSAAAQSPTPGAGVPETGAQALPERQALSTGTTYRSDAPGASVTFTATAAWAVLFEMPQAGFALIDQGRPPIGAVSAMAFDGEVYEDPCDPGSLTRIDATADGLIDFLAGHELLTSLEEPADADVAGVAGRQVDVTAAVPRACGREALLLRLAGGLDFVLSHGQTARFVALEVDESVVVVPIEVFRGMDWEPFLARAMELLESFDVQPAAAVTADESPEPGPAELTPAPEPTPAERTPTPELTPAPTPDVSPAPISPAPGTPAPGTPAPASPAPEAEAASPLPSPAG